MVQRSCSLEAGQARRRGVHAPVLAATSRTSPGAGRGVRTRGPCAAPGPPGATRSHRHRQGLRHRPHVQLGRVDTPARHGGRWRRRQLHLPEPGRRLLHSGRRRVRERAAPLLPPLHEQLLRRGRREALVDGCAHHARPTGEHRSARALGEGGPSLRGRTPSSGLPRRSDARQPGPLPAVCGVPGPQPAALGTRRRQPAPADPVGARSQRPLPRHRRAVRADGACGRGRLRPVPQPAHRPVRELRRLDALPHREAGRRLHPRLHRHAKDEAHRIRDRGERATLRLRGSGRAAHPLRGRDPRRASVAVLHRLPPRRQSMARGSVPDRGAGDA